MTFSASIRTLREEGDEDSAILTDIIKIRRDLEPGVLELRKENPELSDTEIVNLISEIDFDQTTQFEQQQKPQTESIGEDIGLGAVEGGLLPFQIAANPGATTQALLEQLQGITPDFGGLDPSLSMLIQGLSSTRDFLNQQPLENGDTGQQIASEAVTEPGLSDLDFVRRQTAFSDDDFLGGLINQPEGSVNTDPFTQLAQGLPESGTGLGRTGREGTKGAVLGLPFGPLGALIGGTGAAAGQLAREAGLPEPVALGIDLGTGILSGAAATGASNVLRRGTQTALAETSRGVPLVARETEGLALRAELDAGKKAITKKIADFSKEEIAKYESLTENLSQDVFEDLAISSAEELNSNVERVAKDSILNKVYPIQENRVQAMTRLQQEANDLFETRVIEKENKIYTKARQDFQGVFGDPADLQRSIIDKIEELRGPPGTATTPEQDQIIRFLIKQIEEIETQGVRLPANSAIQNRQNLSQFLNYDPAVRSQKDRVASLINDYDVFIDNVGSKRPTALKTYRAANELHEKNIETWGSDVMKTLRSSEVPESTVERFTKPSNLQKFKTAFVGENESISSLERQVLDSVAEGNPNQIKQYIRQNDQQLTKEAKQAAFDLANPVSKSANTAKKGIVEDVTTSIITGQRPEQTLRLMQNPKGFNLAKEATTPKVFDSLKRLFFEDVIKSIVVDGQIDFPKAATLMQNDNLKTVIRNIGGQSLVNNLENLGRYSKNITTNLERLGPQEITRFKAFTDNLTNKAVWGGIFSLLGVPTSVITKLGLVGLAAEGASAGTRRLFFKMVRNKEVFKSLEPIIKNQGTKNLIPLMNRATQTMLRELDAEDLEALTSGIE